jgi:hypothetical protein
MALVTYGLGHFVAFPSDENDISGARNIDCSLNCATTINVS